MPDRTLITLGCLDTLITLIRIIGYTYYTRIFGVPDRTGMIANVAAWAGLALVAVVGLKFGGCRYEVTACWYEYFGRTSIASHAGAHPLLMASLAKIL